jgi:lysophospholipase L1-like esterase
MRNIILYLFLAFFSTAVFAQNKRLAVIGSSTAKGYGLANPETESWVNRVRNHYVAQSIIASPAHVVNLAQSSTNCVTGMPNGYVSPYSAADFKYPDTVRNITAAINLFPKPDVIIVSYPTNGYDWMPFNDIINDLTVIKNTAEAAGIRCYITSTQPRNTFGPGERQKLRNLKDTIMKRFGEFAIDFYSVLASASDSILSKYNLDGVHPNAAGHEELFKLILAKNIFQPAAPPPPANQPPVANAGADISITLPSNSITLNGSGTDADGNIASYQWNKISGPTPYSISTPGAASTTVNNLEQGIYQFELTVTDNGGLTAKDIISVTVNAAPPPPPPAPTPGFSEVKATKQNKKIVLNWSVNNQPQSAGYTIERSRNGASYEIIGHLNSNGSSTASYDFTDDKPFNGSNFYKIHLAENNVVKATSEIVRVYSSKKTFLVYGMRIIQVRDKMLVEIESETSSMTDVTIINYNGIAKKLSSFQLHKGSNSVSFSLSNIPSGIYFLRFSNGMESETVKAFKQ